MTRARGSIDIRRPVEDVFDVVADRRNEPAYNPKMIGAVRPVPGGTRFSWDWDVAAAGPARFAGPVIGWIGRRQERTIWTGLRRHLEAASGAP